MPYLMRTYMTDDLSNDYCLSYIGNFLIRQLISTTSSPSNSLLHIRHLSLRQQLETILINPRVTDNGQLTD